MSEKDVRDVILTKSEKTKWNEQIQVVDLESERKLQPMMESADERLIKMKLSVMSVEIG